MRFGKRMLLIPEDVYRTLMTLHQQPNESARGKTVLGFINDRVNAIATGDRPSTSALNDSERAIGYQQEFKRMRKLQQDVEERPMNVRVESLSSATDKVLKAIEDVKKGAPSPKRKSPQKRRVRSREEGQTDSGPRNSTEYDTPDDDHHSTKKSSSGLLSSSAESSSSSANTEVPNIEAEANEQNERRRQEALKYSQRNTQHLPIDDEGRVYRLMHGEFRAIANSNIQELLQFHFTADKRAVQPPGYKTFINAAKKDPYLMERLFPPTHDANITGGPTPLSSAKGKRGGGYNEKKGKRVRSLIIKKNYPFPLKICFKPKIW